ncbi:MAG TPA: hypothetical protein DDZ43_11760, partial [Hyphomonadaceae bacterium]|nr:hypothetical protein [Hyphomonadaceae bacterium]
MIAQSKSTNISLAELVDQANGLDWGGPTPTSEPLITQFLTQSHSALDGDLLARISPDLLATLLKDFWLWGETREDKTSLVRTRLIDPTDNRDDCFTVLEVIGEDMPFLVGSILGACRDANLHADMVIHPILEHGRDSNGKRVLSPGETRDSYIQIYMEEIDADSADKLVNEIQKTLGEVRSCVADFATMQTRMRDAAGTVGMNAHMDSQRTKEAEDFLRWLANDHF